MDNTSVPTSEAPKHRKRWYNSTKLLISLVLTAALLGAAIFFARPALKALKTRQAKDLATEAQKLGEDGQWDEASRVLGEAFRKDSTEPMVLRTIAQFMRKTGGDPEKALFFWRQLVRSKSATLEDRTSLGACLLLVGQFSEAREILEGMTPEERNTRFALELESGVLRSEGRNAEADTVLRRGLLMAPEDPEAMLKLATLDMSNPFGEVQFKALDILWSLARGTTAQSVVAIQLLASDSRLTSTQSVELVELASKNKRTTPPLRYAVLTAFVRLRPLDKEALVEKEAQANEGKPINQTADYLRWLFTMKEHERLLKLLTPDKAVSIPELFPLFVESLAAQQRWTELQTIVSRPAGLPISPTDLSLLKARCSQALNETPDVIRRHLEEACRRAIVARDTTSIMRTTAIAEALSFEDVALIALREAVAIPQIKLVALERILHIQTKQKDSEGMLATLRDIVAAKPGLRIHQENSFYLRMLVGQDIETAPLQAAQMVKEGKMTPATRHLMDALVAYREGDATKIRETLATLDPEILTTGQRAVYAGMLSACGDPTKAFAIAEKLQRSLLLHEEERFLNLAL